MLRKLLGPFIAGLPAQPACRGSAWDTVPFRTGLCYLFCHKAKKPVLFIVKLFPLLSVAGSGLLDPDRWFFRGTGEPSGPCRSARPFQGSPSQNDFPRRLGGCSPPPRGWHLRRWYRSQGGSMAGDRGTGDQDTALHLCPRASLTEDQPARSSKRFILLAVLVCPSLMSFVMSWEANELPCLA